MTTEAKAERPVIEEAKALRETLLPQVAQKFEAAVQRLCDKAKDGKWAASAVDKMLRALMDEHRALQKIEQAKNRRLVAERKAAQVQRGADRRRDTQEKIILGALAKKVGVACMRDDGSIDTAIFAGFLLDARFRFEQMSEVEQAAVVESWRTAGRAIVSGEKK